MYVASGTGLTRVTQPREVAIGRNADVRQPDGLRGPGHQEPLALPFPRSYAAAMNNYSEDI